LDNFITKVLTKFDNCKKSFSFSQTIVKNWKQYWSNKFLKEDCMKIHWIIRTLILIPVVLSACAPAMVKEAIPGKPNEAKMEKPTETMMEKPTDAMVEKPADAMVENPADAMMESPKWFSVPLTNVETGQPFKVADYKGKVVLVEAMAQWCPTCKKQQQQVLELQTKLGENPDFISIALDIDPNEDGVQLKKYLESNGFTWTYAVSPAEVSNELASLYGTQFLNPPSTPMVVIDRLGKATVFPLGTIKSSNDLQKVIEPLLKAGM
jgi:thiol-disulfide isomerase/thioredoxin